MTIGLDTFATQKVFSADDPPPLKKVVWIKQKEVAKSHTLVKMLGKFQQIIIRGFVEVADIKWVLSTNKIW